MACDLYFISLFQNEGYSLSLVLPVYMHVKVTDSRTVVTVATYQNSSKLHHWIDNIFTNFQVPISETISNYTLRTNKQTLFILTHYSFALYQNDMNALNLWPIGAAITRFSICSESSTVSNSCVNIYHTSFSLGTS